jgi:adenylate cyclase
MERKLTAILSADVKGYSRLMGQDEEATIRTLTAYREVMTTFIGQHAGRVVDSPGDNLLAEFASVVDAVRCAVEIQQELKVRNTALPDQRKMEFRIGINLGDVVIEGERIYGDGVNIAARLESLAEPSGICISGTVYDQIESKLALNYESLGEQPVKNITRPVRAYRVVLEPRLAAIPTPRWEQTSLLPLLDKPSLAVLPFVNMSGDPEQEYFSDGITEDLITDLSRLSGLFVIARNSSFYYKGKTVKVQEVGKELGVRYVLEGSVRRAGDRVRITAQLVDAPTGHHLWAERYDRELHDIFALQDEITQEIVSNLGVEVRQAELERVRRTPTANLTAYDYFLRGWEYQWRLTREMNLQAQQMWEKAIELDPQYAEAYAWLGSAHFLEWAFQWNQDPQVLERVFALAQQALALDNSLPEAHGLLSLAYLWKRQHEQAIAAGERAIALGPNDAMNYLWLAEILNFAGRPEEALGLAEKAMRLDPRNQELYLFQAGTAYFLTARTEEALAAFKRFLTCYPNHLAAHLIMAAIYAGLGQEETAQAEAAEVLRINPQYSLEMWKQTLPTKDPAVGELALALLRKAGLK